MQYAPDKGAAQHHYWKIMLKRAAASAAETQ
jgi:hypothetical protein